MFVCPSGKDHFALGVTEFCKSSEYITQEERVQMPHMRRYGSDGVTSVVGNGSQALT